RRGRRSHRGDTVRLERGADDRGRRLSPGDPGVLRGADPAAADRGARSGAGGKPGMSGPMQPRARSRRQLCAALVLAALLLQHSASSAPAPKRELAPLPASKTALVQFEVSPFPYRGEVPEKNQPFLDVVDGERRGHQTARGGTYWEDQTYNDQRVLLHIPR